MASTTTNLGLTKPAYSDDADISDINGNMDLIDAEAGKVRANVAANYDSSETYAVGDYCLHDGNLYKCTTAISSPESWTAGHWTQIKIAGELSSLTDQIAKKLEFVLVGNVSTTTTKTLTMVSNTKFYLFTFPLGGGNGSIHEVFSSSTGVITNNTVSSSGSITITSNSNNTVVIAGTTSANIVVYAIVFEGSVSV